MRWTSQKNPNGTVLWSAPTNSGTLGGNTVSVGPDGTIWVLGRRRIIGVSSSTGQTKCTYTYNDGEATGLVVDGLGNVYVFYLGNYFSQTQLVALSNECKLLWNVSQPIFITTAETVGMALSPKGDALYLSSTHEPKLIAFNTANGKVNWEYPVKSSQNPSVGPDGTIYVAAGASGLIAISPTGSTLWKRHERAIQTVVLSANNDLFTASGVLSVEAIPASHRLK
jgi:outer membrane protein assembly factor BamB